MKLSHSSSRTIRAAACAVVATLVGVWLAAGPAAAGVIFEDDFEDLDPRWSKNINGAATIEIVPGGVEGNCLKVTADGGLGYLTTQLDPEQYAGTTIEVRGMVRLDNVEVGPQTYSTAKFHIGVDVGQHGAYQNRAARWLGTADWAEKVLNADIDENAIRIILDLGIQNGKGTVYFDNLVVRDAFGKGRPISLFPIANLGRSDGIAGDGKGSFLDTGMNDLFALPAGNLETEEVTLYIPEHGDNAGQTCVILKGRERPDFPEQTEPLPVGNKAKSLHFLQAAAWADIAAQEPCLSYEIEYADGEATVVDMRAGVDVGNYDGPKPAPGWTIAWEGDNGAGKHVGVGVARWDNPRPDVAIASLRIRSAGNGVPIVLAISYLRG
jgi:hypothetical protein